MPRALAAFKRVGLKVVPAPAGTQGRSPQFDRHFDLQMNKQALMQTTAAIKEIVGLLIYRCLGWA